MSTITSQLTNRDLALLAWVTVFATFVLVSRHVRSLLKPLVPILFFSKVTIILLAMVAYVSLLIAGGYHLGAWQPWMLKDSLYWFFGTALIIFFRTNQASKDEHFFKRAVFENLRLAVLLDFIVNLYVFNLVVELLLLPVVTLLGMLLVVAEMKPEYAQVKTLLRWLTAIAGLAIVVHAGIAVISDPGSLATVQNLQDLLLPLVLTILFLPFVYGFALYMGYETLYVHLKIFGRNQQLTRFTMWQIVKTCGFRHSRIRRFSSSFLTDARSAETRAEVLTAIKQFQTAARARKL